MHKTYVDTYQIQGFTGGYWAYAINTNETAGVSGLAPSEENVPKAHRRLGVYYLGWESIEVRSTLYQQMAFRTITFADTLLLAPRGRNPD
jgi:hypothetical protein